MPDIIKYWQRGDTIIEVMVVLTILGLAIGISYATANRSLLNTRQAQENSYATNLAQSQLEALYARSANGSTDPIFIPSTTAFCLNTTNSNAVTAIADDTNFGHYTPACSPSGGSFSYSVAVVDCTNNATDSFCNEDPSATWGPDTFVVKVTWPDVLGQGTNGNDTVTLSYRVHPSS